MDDMGILRTTIAVESHTRRGALVELADTMVDTGSEYTWVPRRVLEQLGIGAERIEHFVTADGRVLAREVGFAIVHAAGARTSDDVVFAQEGDMTLLGAHTIEGMNLRVDLKQRRPGAGRAGPRGGRVTGDGFRGPRVVRRSLVLLTVASVVSAHQPRLHRPFGSLRPCRKWDLLGIATHWASYRRMASGWRSRPAVRSTWSTPPAVRFGRSARFCGDHFDRVARGRPHDRRAHERWRSRLALAGPVDARDGSTRDAWSDAFECATAGAGEPTEPRRFAAAAWSRDGAKLAGITYSANGFVALEWKRRRHTRAHGYDGESSSHFRRGRPTARRSPVSSFQAGASTLACRAAAARRHRHHSRRTARSRSRRTAGAVLRFAENARHARCMATHSRGGAPPDYQFLARHIRAVGHEGRPVLFGVQDYRAFIAVVPSGGGPTRQLTTFQSETPTWSRDDRSIGFTYGSWRRMVDDIRYPDIAQDLGVVRADAARPPRHL